MAAPASAQTFDISGANELQKSLSAYFGEQAFKSGVLSVEPDSDAFKLTFKPQSLFDLLSEDEKVKATLGPLAIRVKPSEKGLWDVTADTFPAINVVSTNEESPFTFDLAAFPYKFDGRFSPELGTFLNATAAYSGIKFTSSDPLSTMTASTGAGTSQWTAVAIGEGAVDIDGKDRIEGFKERVEVKGSAEGETPMAIDISAAELHYASQGKALKSRALLDLWAFFVAHQDETKLKANQDELKRLLRAGLPFWNQINGTYRFVDFKVDTMLGGVSAKELSQTVALDGATANAGFKYNIAIAGLEVPTFLLPEGSAEIVPTGMDLTISTTGLDLATIAQRAIDDFDLNREPVFSTEFETSMAEQFNAETLQQSLKVNIERSTIRNKDSELSVVGQFGMVGEKPEGQMTLEMSGFDPLVEHLKVIGKQGLIPEESATYLLLVKGFAKNLPDGRLQWVVDIAADGSVHVNGALVKPADAPEDAVEPGTDDESLQGLDDDTSIEEAPADDLTEEAPADDLTIDEAPEEDATQDDSPKRQ